MRGGTRTELGRNSSGTQGGNRPGNRGGTPPELFRLCSASIRYASRVISVSYDASGTTEPICTHTPPYPPRVSALWGRRAARGTCARNSSVSRGSFPANGAGEARGNSRAFHHSLFSASGISDTPSRHKEVRS